MKANRKRRGAVLILVIVVMSLMAFMMLVLSEGANTMLFQADTAYCRAVERNLTASALVWSQSQAVRRAAVVQEQPTALDCHGLGGERVALTVQFMRTSGNDADVRIEAFCSKGRQTLKESQDYAISWP
jgi:hypothetical protein